MTENLKDASESSIVSTYIDPNAAFDATNDANLQASRVHKHVEFSQPSNTPAIKQDAARKVVPTKDVRNASAQTYYSLSKNESPNASIAAKLKTNRPIANQEVLVVNAAGKEHIINETPPLQASPLAIADGPSSRIKTSAVDNNATNVVVRVQLDLGADRAPEDVEFIIVTKPDVEKNRDKRLPSFCDTSQRDKSKSIVLAVSQETCNLVLMTEANMLVTPQEVASQYVSTLVPLPDNNTSSVLDLTKEFPVKIYQDDDNLTGRLRKASSPDNDVFLWGIGLPLRSSDSLDSNRAPDSDTSIYLYPAKKENAFSHLHNLNSSATSGLSVASTYESSSTKPLAAVGTRMILRMLRQPASGVWSGISTRPSCFNQQIAFNLKLDSEELVETENNQINFLLQYDKNDDPDAAVPNTTSPTETVIQNLVYTPLQPQGKSMVTVEVDDTGPVLDTTVHYTDGTTPISTPLAENGAPLSIKLSTNSARQAAGGGTRTTIPTTKSILKIGLSAAHLGTNLGTEPVYLTPGGGPVKIRLPVGKEKNMNVTLTAQLAKDERAPKERTPHFAPENGKKPQYETPPESFVVLKQNIALHDAEEGEGSNPLPGKNNAERK